MAREGEDRERKKGRRAHRHVVERRAATADTATNEKGDVPEQRRRRGGTGPSTSVALPGGRALKSRGLRARAPPAPRHSSVRIWHRRSSKRGEGERGRIRLPSTRPGRASVPVRYDPRKVRGDPGVRGEARPVRPRRGRGPGASARRATHTRDEEQRSVKSASPTSPPSNGQRGGSLQEGHGVCCTRYPHRGQTDATRRTHGQEEALGCPPRRPRGWGVARRRQASG